jgi:hypothetical protein
MFELKYHHFFVYKIMKIWYIEAMIILIIGVLVSIWFPPLGVLLVYCAVVGTISARYPTLAVIINTLVFLGFAGFGIYFGLKENNWVGLLMVVVFLIHQIYEKSKQKRIAIEAAVREDENQKTVVYSGLNPDLDLDTPVL